MSGKQLDEHIREMLKNHQVPFEPDHWDLFEHEYGEQLGGDDLLGDDMIDDLKQFQADPIPGDWDVLSSMLDDEDALEEDAFDTEIRKTVDRLEVPYAAHTWPILERKLTAAEIRRRRMFITKVLEVASILLLLFTFYNFYPEIRSGLSNKAQNGQQEPFLVASEHVPMVSSQPSTHEKEQPAVQAHADADDVPAQIAGTPDAVTASNAVPRAGMNKARPLYSLAKLPPVTIQDLPVHLTDEPIAATPAMGLPDAGEAIRKSPEAEATTAQKETLSDDNAGAIPSLPLKLHVPLFDNLAHHKLYGAIQPVTRVKARKRVGIYASAGINVLHFPADNFFSGGEQITFHAQDLPALGYGGGFSIGWFGKRFGFETGIQYSNKSFKPGRQLLIGESLENSKVDFQAVQIDLVTVPLTLTYQVKPTGKLRFYALGGFGFNLIAQAHYDLKIENNYPLPLSITQSASALASNREAHRIREHILDGATFKSKTHVTAIVGFGLENYISHDLSLFVQPAYAHQIPLDQFSNNNGKNFKNLNIRFGARTTIH